MDKGDDGFGRDYARLHALQAEGGHLVPPQPGGRIIDWVMAELRKTREALAAPRATDAAGLVERLARIADASKRDDGTDIPLGEYCREAAATIAAQAAEIERLRGYIFDLASGASPKFTSAQLADRCALTRTRADEIMAVAQARFDRETAALEPRT